MTPKTHELQQKYGLLWETVHSGSAASCAAELERARRHWPGKEWRTVTVDEAKRDRRRKPWSVRDADHVPKGSRVMLAVSAVQKHPSIATRFGVVKHRYRSGSYMVQIDGSKLSVAFERVDLYYPVPDDVIAFEAGRKRNPRKVSL